MPRLAAQELGEAKNQSSPVGRDNPASGAIKQSHLERGSMIFGKSSWNGLMNGLVP